MNRKQTFRSAIAETRASDGRQILFLLAITLAGTCACTTAVSSDPADPDVASTVSGEVRGETIDSARLFRGIPFAAPPVGENRWRAAQPAKPWEGVLDATRFGPDCIQPTRSDDPAPHPQSEDCLSLSIAAPAADTDAPRPVLFYIHGGAYAFGAGRSVLENGVPDLVDEGAIIVAPNYRVGRMGFFAHPALTEEAEAAGSDTANFWLTDEIAALEWVEKNIAAFGGDPDNVTLLGCSAGGSSVNALLASPQVHGLFDKAVVRSGGGFFNATRSLETAESQGQAFAERAGVDDRSVDILAELRALSPDEVLAADPGPPNYGAVIDGSLLEDSISVIWAEGKAAPVPVISGSTSNEASVFGLMGFDKALLKERFDIDVDGLRPVYDTGGALPEAELLRQVQTDFIFTSASLGMATLAAAAGQPSWAYHFDYIPPADREDRPGADHCEDMDYLFASAPFKTPEDEAIANLLQAQLRTFMKTGTPNGPGLPEWPQVQPGTTTPFVISAETEARPGFRGDQMQPWYEKWESDTGLPFPSASPQQGE